LSVPLLLVACGSDDSSHSPGVAAGGSGHDASAGKGGSDAATTGDDANVEAEAGTDAEAGTRLDGYGFGLAKVFLGDTNKALAPDPSAWQLFGSNLDALTSTASSANHCQLAPGAPASEVQADGPQGLDNSWARNVVPILGSLLASPSSKAVEELSAGATALAFHTTNFGHYTNIYPVPISVFDLSPSATAAWSFERLVTFESVVNGDIGQPLLSLPETALKNSVLESGPPSTLTLTLFGKELPPLALRIHRAHVSMFVHGSLNGPDGDGSISGVVDTEELVLELGRFAASLDPKLCDPPSFESIAAKVRLASDIMKDGTNGDPGVTCDGISLGIGFHALAVALMGVAPAQQQVPDPCQ